MILRPKQITDIMEAFNVNLEFENKFSYIFFNHLHDGHVSIIISKKDCVYRKDDMGITTPFTEEEKEKLNEILEGYNEINSKTD